MLLYDGFSQNTAASTSHCFYSFTFSVTQPRMLSLKKTQRRLKDGLGVLVSSWLDILSLLVEVVVLKF